MANTDAATNNGLAVLFLLGLFFCAVSVFGLGLFLNADWFHDPGPYIDGWHGYEFHHFVGLAMFTVFMLVGLVLVSTVMTVFSRTKPGSTSAAALAPFGLVIFVLGLLGLAWGWETMKCLGAFCLGGSYVEDPDARPEAGLGWKSFVGMKAFCSLSPLGIALMLASFRSTVDASERPASALTPSTVAKPTTSTMLVVLVVPVLLAFFVVTTYVPNSWEYFVAARISKNAALRSSTNITACLDYHHPTGVTCPEVGWAFFRTENLKISEALYLKLYPSNCIFFGYLVLMVVMFGIARASRRGRNFVKGSVRIICLGEIVVGNILMLLSTLLMLGLFFFYWIHDHNYNGQWEGTDEYGMATSERWARSLGQLAVAFMSLLFFPASRTSCMHSLFSSSWEASLWMHRCLGYGMLISSAAHMVIWYVRHEELGIFPRSILSVPVALAEGIDNFTIPLVTVTTWLLLICMGIFTLPPIRRRFFELFYYSHIFAAYATIPAVMWHAAAGWEYLLPGLTVWLFDQIAAVVRTGARVTVSDVHVFGDVTAIRFQKKMTVQPGQYVYVNIPQVALLEWHPFTVSSGQQLEFTLHIKSMGQKTWSQRLNDLGVRGDGFAMGVDGPYGTPIDFADYSRIVFVVGGIGVTPSLSIASALKGRVHTHLLWVLRDISMIQAATTFSSSVAHVGTERGWRAASALLGCPEGSKKAFLTRGCPTETTEIAGININYGRPNIPQELKEIAGADADTSRVLVFACGPAPLVREASRAAYNFGFHFHAETFLL
eukprot:TRINITY_DN15630_c0_g1_i1.p1 TRINITY_DN15630_c0_g1~~TRINITY_DN15630_c0_g1_i1.p1  ORF type:complete len:794 (-),score=68.17 TRINITY_DN15630_c0_g1_i1:156-2477(-)